MIYQKIRTFCEPCGKPRVYNLVGTFSKDCFLYECSECQDKKHFSELEIKSLNIEQEGDGSFVE